MRMIGTSLYLWVVMMLGVFLRQASYAAAAASSSLRGTASPLQTASEIAASVVEKKKAHHFSHHLHRKKALSIVKENALPGDSTWFLPATSTVPSLEGFTASFSHYPGDSVHFKIDCSGLVGKGFSSSSNVELRVFRLGYYNDTGARLINTLHFPSEQCSHQPQCLFEDEFRMTTCKNWKVSVSWTIPVHVVSGVFVALPSVTHKNNTVFGSYIPFVVKQSSITHSKHASEILFKTADLTWVAYNKYGGRNVYYQNHSKDFATRAFKASYDRPFRNRLSYPIGQDQNFLFNTEFPMLFWLEKHGYDVSYVSCSDIDELYNEHRLFDHRVLLSVGHDEYWTPTMRQAYLSARDQGIHLAFFSANEMFWRVIWEEKYHPDLAMDLDAVLPAGFLEKVLQKANRQKKKDNDKSQKVATEAQGLRFRSFVCRKESIGDVSIAVHEDWFTGTFIDPRYRMPEPTHAITGQLFAANAFRHEAMTVDRNHSAMRLWRDTALVDGLRQSRSAGAVYVSPRGLLGYELDTFVDDLFTPPGLISFSSTKLWINQSLIERFGGRYGASGWIDHRLTLYRYHIDQSQTSTTSASHGDKLIAPLKGLSQQQRTEFCAVVLHNNSLAHSRVHDQFLHYFEQRHNESQQYHNEQQKQDHAQHHARSALVFAAGTMQWSWALSSFRDGGLMAEDFNVHQATLNLFADMHVLPYALKSNISADRRIVAEQSSAIVDGDKIYRAQPRQLVMPSLSKDKTAPVSIILSDNDATHHRKGSITLMRTAKPQPWLISGRAVDIGGGHVAAVEVSVNAGLTWHRAQGTERWTYVHHFDTLRTDDQTGFYVYNASHPYPQHASSTEASRLRAQMMSEGVLYSQWSQRSGQQTQHMIVLSRAIDDSGWIESADMHLSEVLCQVSQRTSAGSLVHVPANMLHVQLEASKG